jgi:glycolate oxidase FAD binding subunit
MSDISQALQQQVQAALAEKTPLKIVGGNSKAFYGDASQGKTLDVSAHTGIINYEPTELIITARAGTPLSEIETVLAEHNQMLPFEPPYFGESATLGGTLACGLSGPRRAYNGAARDFMLGCKIINGNGEIVQFGGEVMKNVAGYDVSRVMVGAFGTLGVLLEVSLKVLPRPESEVTLLQQCSEQEAIARMNDWAGKPLPLSASCYTDDKLYIRLSGMNQAVTASAKHIEGDIVAQGTEFWADLREHKAAFFKNANRLWRISVPTATDPLPLSGQQLIEWGGGQRWLKSEESADAIRSIVQEKGGHATLFRGAVEGEEVFHPLSKGLQRLHQNMKHAFDPRSIFNPNRLYPGL